MVLENLPGGFETPHLSSILGIKEEHGNRLEITPHCKPPTSLQLTSQLRASYTAKFYSETEFIFRHGLDDKSRGLACPLHTRG